MSLTEVNVEGPNRWQEAVFLSSGATDIFTENLHLEVLPSAQELVSRIIKFQVKFYFLSSYMHIKSDISFPRVEPWILEIKCVSNLI